MGSAIIKRNHSDDYITLKVPKSVPERRRLLLQHLLGLPESCTPSTSNYIDNPFANIKHIATYTDEIRISEVFTCGVDEASSQIRQFVLDTSIVVFYRNQYQDDCAYFLDKIDQIATAKVSRKTYINKHFAEIPVFIGHYELLITGGYIHRLGSMTSFLGSSVKELEIREDATTLTKVPAVASGYINTKRLLNQYLKRHSHQLWGFHCARTFTKGFYPIPPVNFMNHASQKSEKLTNHHFTSAVLALISSPNVIKPSDMESLCTRTRKELKIP